MGGGIAEIQPAVCRDSDGLNINIILFLDASRIQPPEQTHGRV